MYILVKVCLIIELSFIMLVISVIFIKKDKDWRWKTTSVTDRNAGNTIKAYVFAAAQNCSNYAYSEHSVLKKVSVGLLLT